MIKNTLYTVERVRKDDTFYGSSHGSVDGNKTLCGEKLDDKWYITNNTFEGVITCKKCLKILKNVNCYHDLYLLNKD